MVKGQYPQSQKLQSGNNIINFYAEIGNKMVCCLPIKKNLFTSTFNMAVIYTKSYNATPLFDLNWTIHAK